MSVLKSIFSLNVLLLLMAGAGLPEISFSQQRAFKVIQIPPSYDTEIQEKPYQSGFFRVRGEPKVTVHTINGDIEVFHNPDIDGIKVDLYLERSFSLWSGGQSLDNYRIILQQQGNHIVASVEDRRSGNVPRNNNIRFNFVVQTPAKVSTSLRTFNGDIFLENVEGHQFLQNQSGNLSINHSSGEIRIVSTTGDIDLANLRGSIFAKTISGNVSAVSNSGEVRVRSVSGDITALRMAGTLVSATTSGNIFADFRDVSGGVYLKSHSGNIDLSLPPFKGFDLEGQAMSYDLSGLNQATLSKKRQNHRDLSVVIREGGIRVQLSTMSGHVSISESEK